MLNQRIEPEVSILITADQTLMLMCFNKKSEEHNAVHMLKAVDEIQSSKIRHRHGVGSSIS